MTIRLTLKPKTVECVCIVALWLLTAATSLAAPVPLTEPQAIKLFYQRNLALLSARYKLDTARAGEVIASAIPNPVLSVSLYGLSPNNNAGFGPATAAQISQLIETGGKRSLRIASSELGSVASEQDLRDATRLLSNGVRKAFYALVLAQKSQALATDAVSRYARIRDVNKLRWQAGDIARSDLLRIEVEALKAQSDLDSASAAEQAAQADLATLLGWPDGALRFQASGDWADSRDFGQDRGLDFLLQKAQQQRPDLKAAQLRVQQAEKDLSLARKLRLPDVTVGAGYTRDPSNNEVSTGGVSLSIPIPVFYNQQGEIGQAAVKLNDARTSVEQLDQVVRADIARGFAAWQSAERVVMRYRNDILKRTDDVRRSAELAYSRGATGILDLIDAQRTYRSVQLDYYTALTNRASATADLIAALGDELKEQGP